VSISSQIQASGSLVLNPSKNRLYYRGTDGFMYYYSINNDWSYQYFAMPSAPLLNQNLRVSGDIVCATDDKIYYVGREVLNNNERRVHGYLFYNNQWQTISPSWSAHSNGYSIYAQSQVGSSLCLSPDRSMLAYIGSDQQVHGFSVLSDWQYTYQNLKPVASPRLPTTSLTFTSNTELFYISSNLTYDSDQGVHHYRWQQPYCDNNNIYALEPFFIPKTKKAEAQISVPETIQAGAGLLNTINVFPNPSTGRINIQIAPEAFGPDLSLRIVNQEGKIVMSRSQVSSQTVSIQVTPGLYYVEVRKKNAIVAVKKVIVLR
jgi:hypothetical protein